MTGRTLLILTLSGGSILSAAPEPDAALPHGYLYPTRR